MSIEIGMLIKRTSVAGTYGAENLESAMLVAVVE